MRDGVAYLYVMSLPNGPCKIGYARSPEARLKAVSREENKSDLVLLSVFAINARWALAAERYAHWILREHHFRGEWFNVSRAMAIEVARNVCAHNYDLMAYEPIPPLVPRGRVGKSQSSKRARSK